MLGGSRVRGHCLESINLASAFGRAFGDATQRLASELRDTGAGAIGVAADVTDRGAVDVLVKQEMRRNTYDPASNTVTVSADRARAIAAETMKDAERRMGFLPIPRGS